MGGGDIRRGDPRFQGEELTQNQALVEAVSSLAAELGAASGQLVLAWLLAQGHDVVPIPGRFLNPSSRRNTSRELWTSGFSRGSVRGRELVQVVL